MLSSIQRLAGASFPPAPPIMLKAEPLSVEFEDGALRNIRLGQTLILQRIYCAVRDHNWGTIPGVIRIIQDVRSENDTHIVFESVHQKNDIDFIWTGTISLTSSQLSFEMEGSARSMFKRNRIGFCVLHDADVAGHRCMVTHTDGTTTQGYFPEAIAPYQPYFNIHAIQHVVGQSVIDVRMEGDTFEMEDQRNWSDASYKTYCTPLALDFPVLVAVGTKIHQKIILSVSGGVDEIRAEPQLVISHTGIVSPLPEIGLCLADEQIPLVQAHINALRDLHLDHLRVDLEPASDDFAAQFAYAARTSTEWHVPLEVALWLNEIESDLQRLSESFGQNPLNVARWLVFHRHELVTSAATIAQARASLQSLSREEIYGGTDAFFTQLNRNRRNPALFDGLTYSNNPQVHAFDNRSLIETLEMQGVQVKNARQFSDEKPIAVSPITLKMRSNPDATSATETPPGELPSHIDPRQMSLFAAVWTLGSIKYNAQAGAHSLTYYTTHGLDGIMDAEGGSPIPDKFPTLGGVYPVYWVFHEIGPLKSAMIRHTQSSHPRLVDALDIDHAAGRLSFLINYTSTNQTATLKDVSGLYQGRELVLKTIMDANAFHTQTPQANFVENDLTVTLLPYGILILRSDPHA